MSEYVALYRKWRPKVFEDVVGQEHITKVLCSEVMHSSVSHAYLFCGSRGTGKTTCAKILAKAVNCENPQNGSPCGVCPSCLAFDNSFDILEMDAASNNGVDNIRDLNEKVGFMPLEMKKRVYIIDEVHMLSDGAFNALLKTLEEPPAHVLFILATTELSKIPPTILSRCKRFDFHRISPENMLPRLRYISDTENIGINDDALRLISILATGAMRDALSMLELFVGMKDVDREKAAAALGVVGNEPVLRLLRAIADKDSASALSILSEIYAASKDMGVLCTEIGEMFRNLLIIKYASNNVSSLMDTTSDVIETLRNVEDAFTKERLLYSIEVTENAQNKLARSGLSRRTVMETAIIKLCDPRLDASPEAVLARLSELEASVGSGAAAPLNTAVSSKAVKAEVKTPSAEKIKAEAPKAKKTSSDDGKAAHSAPRSEKSDEPVPMLAFGELLDEVKSKDMATGSLIGNAQAFISGDKLLLRLNFFGHYALKNDVSKQELIQSCASKILGMNVKLELVLDDDSGSKPGLDLADF